MNFTYLFLAILVALQFGSSLASCNNTLVEDYIGHNEGVRKCAYTDSRGYRTVGIGFNLDAAGAQKKIEALGVNYHALYTGKVCLTLHQVDQLFQTVFNQVVHNTAANFPSMNSYGCPRRMVLIDFTYNLGQAGVAKWKNFISQVKSGQWEGAGNNMLNSAYCKQVGRRCTDNAKMLKTNQFVHW
eukprot:TRINITY_DN11_c1_g1_i1.p1 TRINITY_DN11_c1_g1~~TRINITY_DN11_c1_g1_i1.p1  ORF type:complete len:185 (+),score=54.01 TRINITY_DN11_c1_g1_i1:47-601(+)